MIFYDYLLMPQLFSYTVIIIIEKYLSCIKYQYHSALLVCNNNICSM